MTKTLCPWCETPSLSPFVCSNCGVAFSTHRFSEEDRHRAAIISSLPDSYSPEERQAFSVLDTVTAREGSR